MTTEVKTSKLFEILLENLMYTLLVDYPRGRAVLFSALDEETALQQFGAIVNDTSVLRFELTALEENMETLFEQLVKIYEQRTENHGKNARQQWLNNFNCKLSYYAGFEDPEEIYAFE